MRLNTIASTSDTSATIGSAAQLKLPLVSSIAWCARVQVWVQVRVAVYI